MRASISVICLISIHDPSRKVADFGVTASSVSICLANDDSNQVNGANETDCTQRRRGRRSSMLLFNLMKTSYMMQYFGGHHEEIVPTDTATTTATSTESMPSNACIKFSIQILSKVAWCGTFISLIVNTVLILILAMTISIVDGDKCVLLDRNRRKLLRDFLQKSISKIQKITSMDFKRKDIQNMDIFW